VPEQGPVTPTPKTTEYEVVAASKKTAEIWDQWAATEPNALAAAYDQLAHDPKAHSARQTRLAGGYRTGGYEWRTFDRWQYEVTSGGRVWYFVDDTPSGAGKRRRPGQVTIEKVFPGHPKGTEGENR
jgi:hypothetical protein